MKKGFLGHGSSAADRIRPHNLPPEVLIVVFDDAISQVVIDMPTPRRCFVTLMRLTQVCSYWRKVAISAPSLWNRINLPSRDAQLLDLHIRRSQNIGLDISIHYSADEVLDLQFDAFLSEYIHRARSVYLRPYNPRTLVLPSGLSNTLINLTVDSRPDWRINRSPAPSNLRMLTQTPSLRRISLYSVKPGWIIPSILASLTHLVLTDLSDPHNVDLPHLLNILSQSPNLIELRTTYAMPSLSSSVFTRTGERIFCANLRRLHLQLSRCHPSQYPLFHLEAPALRELNMYSCVTQLPPISDVLPITLIDLNALDVQAARVTHQNLRSTLFQLYSDANFESEVFTYAHKVGAFIDLFHGIIRTHRLHSITSLLIHYESVSDATREFQYLTSLRNIRSIHFECSEHAGANSLGYDFFPAVIDMQRQNESSILPMLEKLTFSVASPHCGHNIFMVKILATDRLLTFLRARANYGKVLKELVIHWTVVRGKLDPWISTELSSLVGTFRFID